MKFSNKRALSQVDWAISLGIFLLYLAWFFVLVKPQFEVSETPTNLLSVAKENLIKNIQWKVEKRPLFIFSNLTGEKEGILINFPYSLNNFSFSDNRYFTLDDGRLLFLGNMTKGTNLFWIVNSSKNYFLPIVAGEIVATRSYTTTKNFRADFSDGLLERVYFNNESKLNNFKIHINGVAIDRTNNSFINSSIAGGYKIYTENIAQKCYVLAENSKVYCFVDLGKEKPHDMILKADLAKFSNYYSNNLHAGIIDDTTCERFMSDYIDFYDAEGGLSFIFDEDVGIGLCYRNGLSFNATIGLNKNVSYMIVAHNGSYTQTLDYKLPYYRYAGGIKKETSGLDENKLNLLTNKNYADLKKELDFPIDRDFIIAVSNSTEEIFRYNKTEPGLEDNVFAQNFDSWCLNKYSDKEKCLINIQIW